MKVCTTYHNVADGWYLIVPEEWKDQITLRRRDSIGQRSVIFYHLEGEGEEPTPFLVIYKFTSQFDRRTPPTVLSCGRRRGRCMPPQSMTAAGSSV